MRHALFALRYLRHVLSAICAMLFAFCSMHYTLKFILDTLKLYINKKTLLKKGL